MNIKKSLLIAGGVVASLAAVAPMASYTYAAESVSTPVTVDGTQVQSPSVAITVSPAITIRATSSYSGTADVSKINEGEISATITSNTKYQISLSAAQTALKTNPDNGASIPAASTLTAGVNGWGIMKDTSAGGDGATYTAIGTAPAVFYQSNSGAQEVKTTFKLGIGVAPDLPSGTYQTTVTVTAATVD